MTDPINFAYFLGGGLAVGSALWLRRAPRVLRTRVDRVDEVQRQLLSRDGRLSALEALVADLNRWRHPADEQLVLAGRGLQESGQLLDRLDGRCDGLDQRVTALVSDTLSLGSDTNARLAKLEEQLEGLSERNSEMVAIFDRQLQEMQRFIVQAAERARQQVPPPAVPPAAPATTGSVLMEPVVAAAGSPAPPVATATLDELMARQRQLQQVFERRRQAEAAFQQPAGDLL